MSGILNCADAAIEKIEQLAVDVKKYRTDNKAEREMGSVDSMEPVNPVELAVVAEPEFQYGAEAFEAHQKEVEKNQNPRKKNTTAKQNLLQHATTISIHKSTAQLSV